MAVKLRLRREGTKKTPHYRIVAADHRSPRDGRFIEIIGHYHPLREPSGIEVDAERALHWLRNGAQPTSAVEKLLRISGVWAEFKPGDEPTRDRSQREREKVSRKKRERQREAAEAAAAPAEPAPAEATAEEPSESDATEESSA